MKNIGFILIICFALQACKPNNAPDVSGIRVDLSVERFEKDFFAIDTNQVYISLQKLQVKYPEFLQDFLYNILGLPPVTDTSGQAIDAIRQFLRDYRPVKDSADKVFAGTDRLEQEVKKGLAHVKYYFPAYKAPSKLITFIGPMDAFYEASLGNYGDVLTRGGLGVGLQLHLGSRFSMYHSEMGQSLYPNYISRRFTPDYIAVNCMKNIIDDIIPYQEKGKSLLDQMVEKGKRMYILDKLLPDTPDTLKTGYTAAQLKGCYDYEGKIWNFFLTNNLLFSSEPALIKGYIADAPNTPEFGEGSPGFIGLFCGWQIVKKYMDKNPAVKLDELLHTDTRKIYEISKYRPK